MFLINAILGQLKKKEFQILALHKFFDIKKKEKKKPSASSTAQRYVGVCSGFIWRWPAKLNFINFGVCMNSCKSDGQCGAAINHKRRAALGAVVWCRTDGSSKAPPVIFWLRKGNDFTKKIFPLVLFCFNWVCTFHQTGHIYWDS